VLRGDTWTDAHLLRSKLCIPSAVLARARRTPKEQRSRRRLRLHTRNEVCFFGPRRSRRLDSTMVGRRRYRPRHQLPRYAYSTLFRLDEAPLTRLESIKKAAAVAAAGMRKYYTGDRPGDVPGNLPDPYYWWECGAMFGGLIDYWYYTGDDQYNNITAQAMQHQIGEYNAFMPPNQSKSLGNDDQAFWGMAAMSAAENKFPDLPSSGPLAGPSWLALAQAVFNTQTTRWNDKTCGGGLNWQIYTFNNGYTYRNTISNGCFFNIAARLFKYTGNKTYSDWAIKTWDWEASIGLMTKELNFYDGSDETKNNCSEINHIQWTYNLGVHLSGAAAMWNAVSKTVYDCVATTDECRPKRTFGRRGSTRLSRR